MEAHNLHHQAFSTSKIYKSLVQFVTLFHAEREKQHSLNQQHLFFLNFHHLYRNR
jgi:hypothetical protein